MIAVKDKESLQLKNEKSSGPFENNLTKDFNKHCREDRQMADEKCWVSLIIKEKQNLVKYHYYY